MTNKSLDELETFFGAMSHSEKVQMQMRRDFERLSSAGTFRVYAGREVSYRPIKAK